MATAKYQAWTNATWAWDSAAAGSPCAELVSELDAWIAAINGNASQVGKQVVKIRDHTSSTTANYRGWGVQLPLQNQAGSLYVRLYSNSAVTLSFSASTGFTDDTSNGGYGAGAGAIGSDTSISWKNTITSSASFIIGYSTVDGEEFFHYGWYLDSSTSYADCVTIMKDQNGEWCSFVVDGGSMSGLVWDDLRSVPAWVNPTSYETTNSTNVASTLSLIILATGLSAGQTFRYRAFPASPDLVYNTGSLHQGTYTTIEGSSDQLVRSAYFGLFIRYTPV